ncbi:MAG: putative Ig domain-containing protein [Acidimicrobiia bacterium]
MTHRHGTRREGGFTLVEMLVAVVIEAMIVGALGAAFIGIVRGTSQVNTSLSQSGDARIAAAYIISDAANSSGPEISLTDTTTCADATPPVAGTETPVVRFDWSCPSSSGTTTPIIVIYYLVSNDLVRRECSNSTVSSSDRIVASQVATATAACSPTANCSGTPTSITVTITETTASNGSQYQYSLTGTFRKLIGGGAPAPTPISPIMALGGGSCASSTNAALQLSGNPRLRVYGTTVINSTDGTSGSGCYAMEIGTSANEYQASATTILTGGSCNATGSSTCPTTTSYTTSVTDPYAGLPIPAGVPSGACTGTNPAPVNGVYPPGVYPTLLSIGGSSQVSMSGTYIFCNGLTVTNSGGLTGTNVLLYFKGGTFSVTGAATVNLAASTTGSYAGVVVWQPAANTTEMSFTNGGTFALIGSIYAPGAEVDFSGGTVGTQVSAIVAKQLYFANSATVTVGTPSTTALSISGPVSLPAWTVNRPYPSTTVTAAGGDGHYIWSATSLPPGLTINSSTGVISGTPTASGAPLVTVTLNDVDGDNPATTNYTLTINAAPSIATTSPLPNSTVNVPYSTTLAATAGTSPYIWSATGLPTGLALNATTGVISGTPTATVTATVAVTLTDAAGATSSQNLSLTVAAGSTTISSVTLANVSGGTAGTIGKGDTITVVFSAQMSVSSFCSTWSGNSTNQSLSGNGDVTVTVNDGTGATNDSISVASGTCTFNFGSINLGSNAYVSGGAATFSGNGSNKSTIAWTAATNTLVITLGSSSGGTLANVTSSTPIYTASTALLASSGGGITNSPFTLANGKQF